MWRDVCDVMNTRDEILRCDSRRIDDDLVVVRNGYTRDSTVADSIFESAISVTIGDGFVGAAVRGYTHDYFVANLVVPRLIRRGSDILAIGDDLVGRVAWFSRSCSRLIR